MSTNEKRKRLARKRVLMRRRALAVLAGVLIPLTAYSLTLTDYLNIAEVVPSADQYEQITTNNTDQVQITPNAELVVVKVVENDDGGLLGVADFGVTSDAGTLSFDAGTTVGTTTTYTASTLYLAPGTYTLRESDVDGYTEGTWSCNAGTLNDDSISGGEIALAFGEQATCTIINNDIAPLLTLNKTVENLNGGTLGVEAFDISINGVEVIDEDPNTVAANTVITISELDLPSYDEGTWSCSDANGLTTGLPTNGLATNTTLTLLPGSDVTCSITNGDLGIDLSIVKTVDDNTPNIGDTIVFTMAVSNAGPDDATDVTVIDIVPEGFTYAGSISGGDSSDDSSPTGTGLSWTIDSLPAGAPAVNLTFSAIVNQP